MKAKRVQVDEIWPFTYAKQKNVAAAKAAPEEAGGTLRSRGNVTPTKARRRNFKLTHHSLSAPRANCRLMAYFPEQSNRESVVRSSFIRIALVVALGLSVSACDKCGNWFGQKPGACGVEPLPK